MSAQRPISDRSSNIYPEAMVNSNHPRWVTTIQEIRKICPWEQDLLLMTLFERQAPALFLVVRCVFSIRDGVPKEALKVID